MDLFEYTYDLVRQIPAGKVSSYGAVAEALGDKVAARAVGRMMNQNPDANTMPCFKIVHSDGRLGGFGLGIEDKVRRLRQDGIEVKDGAIVDFPTVFFTDFETDYPLRTLRRQQETASKKVRTCDEFDSLRTVGGIDVSYPESEFETACGACVVMDYQTKEVLEEQLVFLETRFPFIPTYFTFREVPFVERLLAKCSERPSILLLDGQGILHPRRCGFASHAGVLTNQSTIGVAKSLLCGSLDGDQVSVDGEVRGHAVRSGAARRPVYVSAGHKVSLASSVRIVSALSTRKEPEPLRRAHELATSHLAEGRQG